MKRLKNALRVWNKDHFGNIFDNARKAEENLACLQGSLDDRFNEDHL